MSRGCETHEQGETCKSWRSLGVTKQLSHYPTVNGGNYANISTTRLRTALPSLRCIHEGSEGGQCILARCNKVIDLPRSDISMHAQLAR